MSKTAKQITIEALARREQRYKESKMYRPTECNDCKLKWNQEVQYSNNTPNLSGEKTVYCPKCNSRNVVGYPIQHCGPIYKAEGTDVDRDFLLGYYYGARADIEAMCTATKNTGYGVKLTVINPQYIPPGTADKLKKLAQRQKELEAELADIKRQLK